MARLAIPEYTSLLYCAVDSLRTRHLLIELLKDYPNFSDTQSRGIKAIIRDLAIQDQTPKKYLDIICLDESGYTIFDLVGGEIAYELRTGVRPPDAIVTSVLSRWRRFWGLMPKDLLSREQRIGLLCELIFISDFLIQTNKFHDILYWSGPWKKRHDFEWPDKSVEVKGTTNPHGRIHIIHGIDQLEKPENGPLFFYSVSLREEEGGKTSLPQLIEEIRAQLKDFPDISFKFEDGLINYGYASQFADEYETTKYRVVEKVLFKVNDAFPKITKHNVPQDLLVGIEHIDYTINLNTYNHLIIEDFQNSF